MPQAPLQSPRCASPELGLSAPPAGRLGHMLHPALRTGRPDSFLPQLWGLCSECESGELGGAPGAGGDGAGAAELRLAHFPKNGAPPLESRQPEQARLGGGTPLPGVPAGRRSL